MANSQFQSVACGNDYTDAATIRDVFNPGGGVFQVQDQPVTYKLQYGGQGVDQWSPEATLGTGGGSIPEGVTGVAFKNAQAGIVATVSALIRPRTQPHLSLTFAGSQSVSTFQRVSAVPASPVDTQAVAYQPDPTNFPGVEWLLIYNSTTGYWDVIGGSPLTALVDASEGTSSAGAYVDLASVGPQLNVPNLGDYDIEYGCLIYPAQNATAGFFGMMAPAFSGVPPGTDLNCVLSGDWVNLPNMIGNSVWRRKRFTGLTLNQNVKLMYKSTSGSNSSFQFRYLFAMPVRIK